MTNTVVDQALRGYVPILLDAAGLRRTAARLRITISSYEDYAYARTILQQVRQQASGPWSHVLKSVSRLTSLALLEMLNGREQAAEDLIERMQLECDQAVNSLSSN